MLVIKKGDVLEATENIICHQVNEDGVMGGGIALQIANKYPQVEQKYKKFCSQYKKEDLLGNCVIVYTNGKIIANCFTQKNFITQYDLVEKVFRFIKNYAKQSNKSIAIPYNYGCGIAKGDWQKVEEILINVFNDYDITIYKLEKLKG